MMTLTEKVAYLKGLAEGMNLDDSKPENKLLKAMIDTLDDMALTISDVEDSMGEISMQIDEIDDDLAAMEEDWYGDEDEDEDEGVYEVECPNCGDTICIDEDMLEQGSIDCPGCGENLEFDFDDDDDDCCCDGGCGCGHDHKD